jgi:uncharacterized protein (TIGR02757 family)
MEQQELAAFLNYKADQYESLEFIGTDPIQIPHRFSKKEDIEIAGFLTATIAWGNRKSIITNANKLMRCMDDSPHEFVLNHSQKELEPLASFVHRTFNGIDTAYFIKALRHLYAEENGLEGLFETPKQGNLQETISAAKQVFFSLDHPERTTKHFPDPVKGSAAKRINMYLRWMVRPADKGVDFGLWQSLEPAQLSCPLDVHSGNVARKLGLLKRKQNDAKALAELDNTLRRLDPKDPVKYDFALFGLGVFEKF